MKIYYGSMSEVKIPTTDVDAQGNVHVEFHASYITDKNKLDKFWLFVFCPDLREGHLARPVGRAVGVVDAMI